MENTLGNQSNYQYPSVVLATWDENLYGSPSSQLPSSSLLPPTSIMRPVNVIYYMKVSFTVGATSSTLVYAHVSWFSPHPDCHALGKPVELWCASLFNHLDCNHLYPLRTSLVDVPMLLESGTMSGYW